VSIYNAKQLYHKFGILVCLILICLCAPAVAQQIYLSPALSEPLEPEFTVDVMIDTEGFEIMGILVDIDFDNTVVALESIEAGEWVTTSGLDYLFYDLTEPGSTDIRFDMAFLGEGYTGSGRLAICHFRAINPGDSPLVFGELDIRDPNNNAVPFTTSEGDLIHIRAGYIYVFPPVTVPTTTDFSVDIAVQSPGQAILGMSVRVLYDPVIVTLNYIDTGTWIISSGLAYSFYDGTPDVLPGVLYFDMAFFDTPLAGSGQVATCHFTAVSVGESPLVFDFLDIRDADNNPLEFTNSTGDLILIDNPIPVEHQTFGSVKALYR
jgi:hypothetical protein